MLGATHTRYTPHIASGTFQYRVRVLRTLVPCRGRVVFRLVSFVVKIPCSIMAGWFVGSTVPLPVQSAYAIRHAQTGGGQISPLSKGRSHTPFGRSRPGQLNY